MLAICDITICEVIFVGIFKNPFKFGTVVKGGDFCDREKEMEMILSDLRSGTHITLISPRRFGKTSLILNLFDKVDFAETFYIDLMGITTIEDFLNTYTKVFLDKLRGRSKIETILKKLLPKIEGLQLNIGSFGFTVSISPTHSNIEEVFSLPEKFKKKVIVAIDEFQEITNIKNFDLLSILRKNTQFFENTTFLFSGSRRHVMKDIFSNPEKPFYRFSKFVNISMLDKVETLNFIKRKFKSTLIDIDENICEMIYDISYGHPYYIQYLSHTLWNVVSLQKREYCNKEDFTEALNQVLLSERPMFEVLWDSLTTNQRIILRNISNGKSPYDTIMSAGSVKRAIDTLVKSDIIDKLGEKYQIIDPMFKIWLKK